MAEMLRERQNSTLVLTRDRDGRTLLAIKKEGKHCRRTVGQRRNMKKRKKPRYLPVLCDLGRF